MRPHDLVRLLELKIDYLAGAREEMPAAAELKRPLKRLAYGTFRPLSSQQALIPG